MAAEGNLLALVETEGGASLLTQFHIDEAGSLTRTVSTPIASAANGIAIVSAGDAAEQREWRYGAGLVWRFATCVAADIGISACALKVC